jgi:hypothetical protein
MTRRRKQAAARVTATVAAQPQPPAPAPAQPAWTRKATGTVVELEARASFGERVPLSSSLARRV